MLHETVNSGNADVSSASVRNTFIPNIENNQHFSRFALSADGTSAFPAIADGLPELDRANSILRVRVPYLNPIYLSSNGESQIRQRPETVETVSFTNLNTDDRA